MSTNLKPVDSPTEPVEVRKEDPCPEAGFSMSFKLYDSEGVERLITMRSAHYADWKHVLGSSKELIDVAKGKEWSTHGRALPQGTEPAQPTVQLTAGDGEEELEGETLVVQFTPQGKKTGKVMGGKYKKFGVTIWPEVAKLFSLDLDNLAPGTYEFRHRVYVLIKEGKPQKVTGPAEMETDIRRAS